MALDWRGTYWGPVAYIPCTLGSANGHLSYEARDPNPNTSVRIPRGPVTSIAAGDAFNGWCGNDYVLVSQPTYLQPDLYFDPPPPIFGGLLLEQLFGCLGCQIDEQQLALALDRQARNPLRYTGWPVNTASGSLTEFVTDLRLTGPGIPFAWTRSYNSRDTSSGPLGLGWTHPFEAKITVFNPSTGRTPLPLRLRPANPLHQAERRLDRCRQLRRQGLRRHYVAFAG